MNQNHVDQLAAAMYRRISNGQSIAAASRNDPDAAACWIAARKYVEKSETGPATH